MADDLPLPQLRSDPTTESFTKNAARKRARLSSPPVSSDPALFSSDDDPSADNYTQERRKKKYRGPWYHQRPASDAGQDSEDAPEKKRRTFERQFDSGVFMGSDGTDVDEVLEELESRNASTLPLPLSHSHRTQAGHRVATTEEVVKSQIHGCLEEGNENIDFSSRGLKRLSNATIRPLATFARVPPVIEGVYTRLEPKLKVFLASNDLTSLPGEIFKLDHLIVLSLRGNQFEELPPGIGKLSSLKELNLSQNSLRCLPFEILELFSDTSRLNSLNLHPNPFYQPEVPPNPEDDRQEEESQYKIGLGNRGRTRPRRGAVCGVSPVQRRRSWHSQWSVTYQVRTEVRYLDINGTRLKGPDFSKDTARIPVADVNDTPQAPTSRGDYKSRAPSLLEVALNACSRTSQLPLLPSYLPEDSPPVLIDLLTFAVSKKDSGGSKCTTCGRNFIVPRTEWIEWWEIAKVLDRNGMASAASPLRQMENERDVLESMVPLMRRGCSWLCVPEPVTVVNGSAAADETELAD
ncbi:uncharacterized protein LY89DRAFT_590708 [Mollisia scopiformis]|uniref:Uncharacterized protein n=1 Tax=Mollisia scopiformis TaxID=149040 RepID=A0A194X0Q1_MOLSC|nr:uncharacterized protein LY89DRAFT_590708 [Mollisia scopiformis]KUJ13776.1 hypothetical protein LY89DRAFT_590708 [Mollisia scopiformis]